MKSSDKKAKDYVFVILLAAISGSFIGEVLCKSVGFLDFLGKSYFIGLKEPIILDLKVINIVLGLNFNLNLMSIHRGIEFYFSFMHI